MRLDQASATRVTRCKTESNPKPPKKDRQEQPQTAMGYNWGTVGVQNEKPLENQGVLVRETGLEPASTYVHMNLNHARLPIPPFPQKMVGRGGFEPPKLIAADLQSAPFGHSGTYPYISLLTQRVELAMGLEPATC